ncbi:sel1 repeat family protein [Jeongeupia wiesaeckerbachi]|uniref:SEL1-like repeat protein n=1 Tax=Jeongeupia wiesaeckerbachi TaxID=3051218 RepID=UPI003D808801
MKSWLLIPLCLALIACDGKPKERAVPELPNTKLAFTCAYEKDHLPAIAPEVEQVYRYARYVQKNNVLKKDASVYPELARLYRIAAANGHYKANLEVRQMIGKGQADSLDPVKETLDLTEALIRQGVPGGYYDMGRYLEKGYGVKKDPELALRYFRKSADMGSPEGQFLVGEKLEPIEIAPDIARQMFQCAAEQGHGEAAEAVGIGYKLDKKYIEALQAFQLGVKAGNATAALRLEDGFKAPPPDDQLDYLALTEDKERSRRYEIIGDTLSAWSYRHPTVPEIDDIVPLPPAKLPPWDGKIQWLKDHEANVAPEKPSEAQLTKLAKAKGLDPATGEPLAEKTAQAEPTPKPAAPKVALGTVCRSGEPCPQSGVWQVLWPDETNVNPLTVTKHFAQGETLPTQAVERRRSGLASVFKGKVETRDEAVSWKLVGLG